MSIAVHPGAALLSRQRLVCVLVLGALTALGSFTIDLSQSSRRGRYPPLAS